MWQRLREFFIGYPNFESSPKIESVVDSTELLNAFEVPDNAPWWLAVHTVINELEKEMIDKAREKTGVDNVLALSSLDNSYGVALVRQRLIETRNAVLQRKAA